MSKVRFKELGGGSFFGDYLFERTVPEDHFLRRLDEVVEWEVFVVSLVQLYLGGARRGRAPYNPVGHCVLAVGGSGCAHPRADEGHRERGEPQDAHCRGLAGRLHLQRDREAAMARSRLD